MSSGPIDLNAVLKGDGVTSRYADELIPSNGVPGSDPASDQLRVTSSAYGVELRRVASDDAAERTAKR